MATTTERDTENCAGIDDESAVVKASYPRKIQERNDAFETALPKPMVQFLNINKQSAPVDPRLIKGTEPVVIDEPAIILRAYDGGTDE